MLKTTLKPIVIKKNQNQNLLIKKWKNFDKKVFNSVVENYVLTFNNLLKIKND